MSRLVIEEGVKVLLTILHVLHRYAMRSGEMGINHDLGVIVLPDPLLAALC
jgi:hypothetical protein